MRKEREQARKEVRTLEVPDKINTELLLNYYSVISELLLITTKLLLSY
jgi:hypothetical protein